MFKRKTVISVSALALVAILAIALLRPWQSRPPRRPAPIPRGDYTYVADLAEFRARQLMRRHDFPSVAVALVDDQETVWQAAFGLSDVESGIPATPTTVYKLWSVAKAFTATETMRLVEEGLVDLDAPITDYLPDFAIPGRFADPGTITVRGILTHRSGLPRNGCHRLPDPPGSRDSLRALVASLADCRLAYPAGTRYKYSNVGPDTLGLIIETLRAQPFAAIMKKNLLDPIGMDSSAFLVAELPGRRVAPGYEFWKGDYYPMEQGDIANLPSGNLYATVEDMAAFLRFLFREGQAGGAQIVKPETLALMFADQPTSPRDPQPMGLGWKTGRMLGGERLVWHDGGPTDGTGALVALLPDRKLGVVLIANEIGFEGPISVSLAIELLDRMLETKFGLQPLAAARPAPVDVDRTVLADYVGRYVTFGQVMDVTLRGDRLKGRIQGMGFDLVPVGQNRFQVSHWLVRLGLADLLPLPMDLRALEIEFLVGDGTGDDIMIIKMGDFNYEICPRYPEVAEIPALWQAVAGEYELVYRLPSGAAGTEVVGRSEILIEDNALKMGGWVGPLLPISETELIILGGSFAGETMDYDPDTGTLSHQSIVFRP